MFVVAGNPDCQQLCQGSYEVADADSVCGPDNSATKKIIIAAVVGSVGGVLLGAVLLYLFQRCYGSPQATQQEAATQQSHPATVMSASAVATESSAMIAKVPVADHLEMQPLHL